MLDQKYHKSLYQLASIKIVQYGYSMTVVQAIDAEYPLYEIISTEEKQGMTDDKIFPFFFGNESELLRQKCLSPYWFWRVIKRANFKKDHPIKRAISEIKGSHPYLPETNEEAIAFGFKLWNPNTKTVVNNPIFYS